MTRAEQDRILDGVTLVASLVNVELCGVGLPPWFRDDLRASLRLDDPVLDDIIRAAKESGQPLRWTSAVPV